MLTLACSVLGAVAVHASTVSIDFEDVPPDGANLTTRYAELGVTFRSIANPYPLDGPFPSPDSLPVIEGDVVSWSVNPELGIQAVAQGQVFPRPFRLAGDDGVLMSFSYDVAMVSVQGVDAGLFYGIPGIRDEDESVTLTAYDIDGRKLGSSYSTANLPGPFDITPARIALPGMRHVSFNYTGQGYGFYALDNVVFATTVPEPGMSGTLILGLSLMLVATRSRSARTTRSQA